MKSRIVSAYKELLDWEILPSQEIAKLMNVLIPVVNGEDNATEYKRWFDREKEHIFFCVGTYRGIGKSVPNGNGGRIGTRGTITVDSWRMVGDVGVFVGVPFFIVASKK